jgi:signal transduction histidine kinase
MPSPLHATLEHALTQTDLLLIRFRAIARISEIERKRRRAGFSDAPIRPILLKLKDLYEPLALQGGVQLVLRMQEDATIHCDPELLFEAIGNLIDNAIKFTPAAGAVTIELQRTGQGLTISVSDTGPGIAAGQRRLVLQRFYRSVESRSVEGSGLGLSLVDAIVRLHEFSLVVGESETGGAQLRLQCWTQIG